MTYQDHMDLYLEHQSNAIRIFSEFRVAPTMEIFDRYKTEDRLARKHWGIAQAMFTKKYGKYKERKFA